jgi:hypothetical protein
MCLYPKIITNRKYIGNKKNGGIIPPVFDNRTLQVPVGCGNCIECRKQKSREWAVRLNEEIRIDKNGYFVTLTFNEPSLIKLTWEISRTNLYHKLEENEVARLSIRRFLERWRKKYKKSLKHWLITELGHTGTERIHIHGLIWDNRPQMIKDYLPFEQELQNIWQYGFTDKGKYVNEQTVNYIVKYVTKIDKDHKGYKPKILTSAGIGKGYLNRIDKNINKFNGKDTKEFYRTKTGLKYNLPIYYRNKLYTEQEREQLWINKLNKNVRYVCGEKIDISKGEETYYKTLKFYQLKNTRLGYGNDTEEWSIKMYKKQRKLLKQRTKKRKE